MITIPPASATYGANNTQSNNVQTNPASERNMFLTLLVAQLKNQDPLAPQDGAQFVAQLAQFNSLDQLIGIRNSIEQLTTLLNQSKPSAS
jgi:flagellar basal-body rod modification protein FlgD